MRTIGLASDPFYPNASRICNATAPGAFTRGRCGDLMECILNNIPTGYSAGMQAGGNIASLVPTTLALIGAPPLELVQLALVSPHRAVATCAFSIGLPSGLFRQLRPVIKRLSDRDSDAPKVRKWTLYLPMATGTAGAGKGFWMSFATIVAVDVVTLALAGVMLWYNWRVTNATMVTWRCEYGWLLFCWLVSLVHHTLAGSILIERQADGVHHVAAHSGSTAISLRRQGRDSALEQARQGFQWVQTCSLLALSRETGYSTG